VTRVVAVGSLGHPMALPAGLDELWGCSAPSLEAARSLLELISFGPATPEAVEARHQAMLAQPWYSELFPAPRQRWVDDLSLTREELAGISAPVLLVHGAQDRVVPLHRSFMPLLELLPDVRGHVFGRCGHAAPLERTGEFNQLLTTFLEADR
jgi:2-hydroxymuconate-semialdehyde hydrolase